MQGSYKILYLVLTSANVAQMVEQLIRNQQARGSSPLVGSIIHTASSLKSTEDVL